MAAICCCLRKLFISRCPKCLLSVASLSKVNRSTGICLLKDAVAHRYTYPFRMSRITRVLIALCLALAPISNQSASAQETCVDFGTYFPGTPYEAVFGEFCGTDEQIAQRAQEAAQYANDVAPQYNAWINEQNAAQQAAQQDPVCETWGVIFPGSPYEADFGSMCGTPEEVAQRTQEFMSYMLQVAPQYNEWEYQQLVAQQGNQEVVPEPNPQPTIPAFDCAQPENMALPICQPQMQLVTNPDGSLNCANPINAVLQTCMDLFKVTDSGALDCSQPELQNLPACVGNIPTPPIQNSPVIPSPTPEPITPQSAAPQNEIQAINPVVELEAKVEKVESAPAEIVPVEAPVALPIPIAIPTAPISMPPAPIQELSPTVAIPIAQSPIPALPVKPEVTIEIVQPAKANRVAIQMPVELQGKKITLRATKKGAKALNFNLVIDKSGKAVAKSKTKLTGYTLALIVDGKVMTKTKK